MLWHGKTMTNPIPRLENLAGLGYPDAIEALARMRVFHGKASSVETEHAWLVVKRVEQQINMEIGA
jgi:hypothetical protein